MSRLALEPGDLLVVAQLSYKTVNGKRYVATADLCLFIGKEKLLKLQNRKR